MFPLVPVGRGLCDSVISHLKKKEEEEEDATTQSFSPEVLYVMLEDSITQFLQHLLLWREKEPSDEASQSSVAESDKLAVSDDRSGSREMTRFLTRALITGTVLKDRHKTFRHHQLEDFSAVMDRLSNLELDERALSAVKETEQMDKLIKNMIKDLKREFGSRRKIILAAMDDQDQSLDNAIKKYLKIHLKTFLNPPQKTTAARVFSAVTQALTRSCRFIISSSALTMNSELAATPFSLAPRFC